MFAFIGRHRGGGFGFIVIHAGALALGFFKLGEHPIESGRSRALDKARILCVQGSRSRWYLYPVLLELGDPMRRMIIFNGGQLDECLSAITANCLRQSAVEQ